MTCGAGESEGHPSVADPLGGRSTPDGLGTAEAGPPSLTDLAPRQPGASRVLHQTYPRGPGVARSGSPGIALDRAPEPLTACAALGPSGRLLLVPSPLQFLPLPQDWAALPGPRDSIIPNHYTGASHVGSATLRFPGGLEITDEASRDGLIWILMRQSQRPRLTSQRTPSPHTDSVR